MTLKEKLKLFWENRGNIVEGFYNGYVSCSPEIKQEALRRLTICRSNICGWHNPDGENNDNMKAAFPGKESCGGCGCDLYAKCHAMHLQCYLGDSGGTPLWEALMTKEQDDDINKIAYRKQFEKQQQATLKELPKQD